MAATTAGRLKQGQTVLWFDSKVNRLSPFKVLEVSRIYPCGVERVHLYLKSSQGSKAQWSGPPAAKIQLPPKPSTTGGI
jgi:hypothetical protein